MSTTARSTGPWRALAALVALGLPLSLVLGLRTELAPQVAQAHEALRLTILHTNDLHGQVRPRKERGGLLDLGRRIRQERDAALRAGEHVLLLDAGDLFQGTLEGNLSEGAVVVDWMNSVGYDAVTVGNHEFDFGVDVARRLSERAQFPFLGSNIRSELTQRVPAWLGAQDTSRLAGRALVREFGGVRVAVIGLTSEEVPALTVDGATEGLRFLAPEVELKEVLEEVGRVDLVIVLSHCGLKVDKRLAEAFKDRIHVIVGGHSHTRLPEGEVHEGVLIVQTGHKGDNLGRVEIELPAPVGGIASAPLMKATLLEPFDDLPGVLEPHLEQVRVEAAKPVGVLRGSLARKPPLEQDSSALGNLITDTLRTATGADVAFQNQGGIRERLQEGPVTFGALYEVLPFGNTVVTLVLSGEQLREVFETQFAGKGMTKLDVSGAKVLYSSKLPAGKRALQILVGGEPLNPQRDYVVAVSNFLAGGKDGYEVFARGRSPKKLPHTLRGLLRDFLAKRSPYTPGRYEARIRRAE